MKYNDLFQSVAQSWLAFLEQQGKSHHTIQAYRRGLDHFVNWYEETFETNFKSDQIISKDILNWRNTQCKTESIAAATINLRVVAVTQFFRWARSQQICQVNPALDIKTIKAASDEPVSLTSDELSRFLRAVKNNARDYAIVEMLAGTGLRIGELLALCVKDVEVTKAPGKVQIQAEDGESFRTVPLLPEVREAILTYLSKTHPLAHDPNASLWFGSRGPIKHRSSITRMLSKYASDAQIKTISPYTLRHTFAYRYLDANPGDFQGLAKVLGCRNLNSVMIYASSNIGDLGTRFDRIKSHV